MNEHIGSNKNLDFAVQRFKKYSIRIPTWLHNNMIIQIDIDMKHVEKNKYSWLVFSFVPKDIKDIKLSFV